MASIGRTSRRPANAWEPTGEDVTFWPLSDLVHILPVGSMDGYTYSSVSSAVDRAFNFEPWRFFLRFNASWNHDGLFASGQSKVFVQGTGDRYAADIEMDKQMMRQTFRSLSTTVGEQSNLWTVRFFVFGVPNNNTRAGEWPLATAEKRLMKDPLWKAAGYDPCPGTLSRDGSKGYGFSLFVKELPESKMPGMKYFPTVWAFTIG